MGGNFFALGFKLCGKGGIGDLIGQLGSLKQMLVGGAVVAGLKATSDAIIGIVDEEDNDDPAAQA